MLKFSSLVAAAVLLGGAAQAATITVQTFSMAEYQTQTSGNAVFENFEDFNTLSGSFENGVNFANPNEGTLNGMLDTAVGRFSAIGGTGTGTTCQNNDANNSCGQLALENSEINGQGNIAPLTGAYGLSSNDTMGITWDLSLGGTAFTRAVFAIRDAADVGQRVLSIASDGATQTRNSLGNGNIQLVTIDFGRSMTSATIDIQTAVNDGFTFDGAAIQVAAVPLPATIALMLGGLGALGAAKRQRPIRNTA